MKESTILAIWIGTLIAILEGLALCLAKIDGLALSGTIAALVFMVTKREEVLKYISGKVKVN